MIRLKAEMTVQFEKLTKAANMAFERYQQLVTSRPFPPSPILIRIHAQWEEEEVHVYVF